MIGLARLGADVQVRTLPDGTPIINLPLAFNYGKKDAAGKRKSVWIDASMAGERVVKLAPYLVKGQQLLVHLADPHIENYTARDQTTGTKLVAYVDHLEFAGDAPQQAAPAPAERQPTREEAQNRQRPAPAARPAPGPGPSGFDDLEDSAWPQ